MLQSRCEEKTAEKKRNRRSEKHSPSSSHEGESAEAMLRAGYSATMWHGMYLKKQCKNARVKKCVRETVAFLGAGIRFFFFFFFENMCTDI